MTETSNAVDPSERPIFLTGCMGAGKSSVALLLAAKLNWEVFDTDRRIEEAAGMSITDIFARGGEAAFRTLEKAAVSDSARKTCMVVALGGGALQDPATLEKVKKAGLLVYLSAPVPVLSARLADEADRRPLIKGLDEEGRRKKIIELLRDREPNYKQAEFEVSTDEHGQAWVADQIFRRWMRV